MGTSTDVAIERAKPIAAAMSFSSVSAIANSLRRKI